jgi:hypothetical protein
MRLFRHYLVTFMFGKHTPQIGVFFCFRYNILALTRSFRWLSIFKLKDAAPVELPSSDASSGLWDRLPPEIRYQIFKILSIKDILAFSATCRLVYHRENPVILSIIRHRILDPRGDLHWFLPVNTVKDDVQNFSEATIRPVKWTNGPETAQMLASIIMDPQFPLLAYLGANYPTDSMRNRRRLWRIAKQFRTEWRKYRTKGYEYNIFEQGFRQLDVGVEPDQDEA